ncbi:hypothetical protein QBC32DRAFT_117850 [Pseudoneurospora amorphoporcata]|uniref:Uncharacterized protein n=1 Tax=Pseudoneurospora amorphoporcata TaxID=241081 RepID=A0AAN6NWU9_9PEZI|nr:hypothetical protein QBC32DRAFT_117850 [Pseudoneurospora amorphoporcata]
MRPSPAAIIAYSTTGYRHGSLGSRKPLHSVWCCHAWVAVTVATYLFVCMISKPFYRGGRRRRNKLLYIFTIPSFISAISFFEGFSTADPLRMGMVYGLM